MFLIDANSAYPCRPTHLIKYVLFTPQLSATMQQQAWLFRIITETNQQTIDLKRNQMLEREVTKRPLNYLK